MYYDDVEKLRSLPASWTSVVMSDPVVCVGRERAAHFRVKDLWDVAERVAYLLERLEGATGGVK